MNNTDATTATMTAAWVRFHMCLLTLCVRNWYQPSDDGKVCERFYAFGMGWDVDTLVIVLCHDADTICVYRGTDLLWHGAETPENYDFVAAWAAREWQAQQGVQLQIPLVALSHG